MAMGRERGVGIPFFHTTATPTMGNFDSGRSSSPPPLNFKLLFIRVGFLPLFLQTQVGAVEATDSGGPIVFKYLCLLCSRTVE